MCVHGALLGQEIFYVPGARELRSSVSRRVGRAEARAWAREKVARAKAAGHSKKRGGGRRPSPRYTF